MLLARNTSFVEWRKEVFEEEHWMRSIWTRSIWTRTLNQNTKKYTSQAMKKKVHQPSDAKEEKQTRTPAKLCKFKKVVSQSMQKKKNNDTYNTETHLRMARHDWTLSTSGRKCPACGQCKAVGWSVASHSFSTGLTHRRFTVTLCMGTWTPDLQFGVEFCLIIKHEISKWWVYSTCVGSCPCKNYK